MTRYQAPDELPSDFVCRQLRIPNHPAFIYAINDALGRLTLPWSWDASANVSSEDAASAMAGMMPDFDNRECDPMIGTIVMHVRSELPDGWLWCDGAEYDRADYPALYNALHENFHLSADTFYVPDLAIRFPLGMAEGEPSFVGLEGGESSHLLTTAEMPAHTHTPANNTHQFVTKLPAAGGLRPASAGSEHWLQPLGGTQTGSAGGNMFHNNMPPYTFTFYAIVAK